MAPYDRLQHGPQPGSRGGHRRIQFHSMTPRLRAWIGRRIIVQVVVTLAAPTAVTLTTPGAITLAAPTGGTLAGLGAITFGRPGCDHFGRPGCDHIGQPVTLVRACPHHHGGPVIAPVPPKPVDKGHLGFGLAAQAIYLRYSHNLPIRRIADMLADDLVPVSEEMLDRLYTETSARIEPVLQALITCVRQAQLVNLDDTPVLILDPTRPDRRRTGHMWVAVGDQRYCWFFTTPS
jgi:hypothetical protein